MRHEHAWREHVVRSRPHAGMRSLRARRRDERARALARGRSARSLQAREPPRQTGARKLRSIQRVAHIWRASFRSSSPEGGAGRGTPAQHAPARAAHHFSWRTPSGKCQLCHVEALRCARRAYSLKILNSKNSKTLRHVERGGCPSSATWLDVPSRKHVDCLLVCLSRRDCYHGATHCGGRWGVEGGTQRLEITGDPPCLSLCCRENALTARRTWCRAAESTTIYVWCVVWEPVPRHHR